MIRFLLLLSSLIAAQTIVGPTIHAQCNDSTACNYDAAATGAGVSPLSPCLTLDPHVVHTSGAFAGMTTYRLYVHLPESDDFLSAISTINIGCTDFNACNYAPNADYDDGSCEYSSCSPGDIPVDTPASSSTIKIRTTTSFHQDPVGSSTATGIMSSLLDFFPDLIYDSWITIGHAPEDGTAQATVSTIASPNQNWIAEFEAGNDLIMDDIIGGLWYIFNDGNDQGVPDVDGKVLIAQLTTDGTITVELTGQYFPDFGSGVNGEADGTQDQLFSSVLGTACPSEPAGDCTYPEEGLDCDGNCLNDEGADGICDEDDPCVGELDECGVCNGPGSIYECGCADIPSGDCDCNGSQVDALGVCGGSCAADADSDGICDDVDDCVGTYDAIGVCNGDCPEDLDEDGICDNAEVLGCTDSSACNYDDDATEEDGSCTTNDAVGVCGGDCIQDVDSDGICDTDDPCVGFIDACGSCNGPGEIYECGCSDIPDGDCDCNGNQVDIIGECGGNCTEDADLDGICDDVDPCIGDYDACGICNGPGEVYQCGCSNIPVGDCDCDGNQTDAIGVCGGECTSDENGNGICDDIEAQFDVYGCTDVTACNYLSCATHDDGTCTSEDALGICGGLCSADADGDGICDDVDDCIGSLDALGTCNGSCTADEDGDGICDDADDCVGQIDECGVCNGVGASFQCGCSNIPEGDCDCNGNQTDALGICGGGCPTDVDGDGICDDVETPGCTDPNACNFDVSATDDDGSCAAEDALGICGGSCAADTDGDGICDDLDDCIGTLDALGVCNGTCSADADEDGICDDLDGCIGQLDECGICNGVGASFQCGCSNIPEGDCDCNGNQTDALGICGGGCPADNNQNGICDNAEAWGCTYPDADNFDALANFDDGSCLFPEGCPQDNCYFDVNGDGGVGASDLLVFLLFFGNACIE